MLNFLLLTKRSSSCFFRVKIMRCNKFSSPLCLSVKNIRPLQFSVGHFEAARPGLCCSARSSTQCSPLYPANILLIFWLFLVFPHKKMSAIGFRRGWKTNLNHHFSVSSCCSELTFMFCYESLKAVALTWVAGNFIIVFSIFILGRVDVKPQVGADWSLCWSRSQLLSRSDQCWVFVGISWVFVGISWVFVG